MQITHIPQPAFPTTPLTDVARVLPQIAQATSSPMMLSSVTANEKGGRSTDTKGRQEASKKNAASTSDRGRSVNIKV